MHDVALDTGPTIRDTNPRLANWRRLAKSSTVRLLSMTQQAVDEGWSYRELARNARVGDKAAKGALALIGETWLDKPADTLANPKTACQTARGALKSLLFAHARFVAREIGDSGEDYEPSSAVLKAQKAISQISRELGFEIAEEKHETSDAGDDPGEEPAKPPPPASGFGF